MPEINLGGWLIGPDHPPLVIGEIGINHEGSLDVAFDYLLTLAVSNLHLQKLTLWKGSCLAGIVK
jgi:sialic acid synthase SpsE